MTVVIGSALDILIHSGTPRVVYNDLPLGNPVGKPGDHDMQMQTVKAALQLADTASVPGEIMMTPFRWASDDAWKKTFMRLDNRDPAELIRLGDENRAQRRANREQGLFR